MSPKGEVVWDGHPGNLKESLIEEHLVGVRLTPAFSLAKELKSAERDLNAGKYSAGLKALEDHLKKPKSAETGTAAKEAIEQVKEYGTSQLKEAEDLAKDRDYGDAAVILRALEKSFKGLETGEKATTLLADWKKDAKIKLELDGAAIIEKADAQVQAKQFRNAAGFLLQVTRGKKFEDTKAREIAVKKLAVVEKKI